MTAGFARTAQSAPATVLVGRYPQNVTRKIQKNLTGRVNPSGRTSEKGTPAPKKGVFEVEAAWAWIALGFARQAEAKAGGRRLTAPIATAWVGGLGQGVVGARRPHAFR